MIDRADSMMTDRPWRLRPVLLAAVGLIAAITVQRLVDNGFVYGQVVTPLAFWRYALASGIGAGAMALGFGLERVRWTWSVAFGLSLGAVVGLVLYWNGAPDHGGFPWDWPSASLLLSVAILLPLFQTARDEGAARFPYADVHGNAWTNVVLWCACWAFVGIVFALAWLLAALFELIGLTFLRDLLQHDWVDAGLMGGAFGAALGLLRDRDRVVRLLQRVVTIVLAVLAPVLAAGLLFFLLALPFTGLHALWDATKATTPILLSCVIGALILANAVIGNGEEEEAANPALQIGAMVLAVCMLPLAVIAAVATGLRIGQYGFSPDRLWAVVFVAFASAYGLAYLVSLARGRRNWATYARPANLTLAFAVAGVALFLALPILSFNAISTHDQVARLESGKVSADKFDWAALAFDFGDPGRAALKRLASSKNSLIAARAKEAALKTNRYEVMAADSQRQDVDALAARLRILPRRVPVPTDLATLLIGWDACGDDAKRRCTLIFPEGTADAFAIRDDCVDTPARRRPNVLSVASSCDVAHFHLDHGAWKDGSPDTPPLTPDQIASRKAGLAAGQIEIRTVSQRQMFVGGVPVGDRFE